MEDESTYMAKVEGNSQPNQGISPVSELIIQENGKFGNSSQNLQTPESDVAGSDTAACNSNNAINEDQKVEQQSCEENVTFYTEDNDIMDVNPNSSREGIDLIEALDSHSNHNVCLNDGENKSEPSQHLDLSLRRFFPCVIENKSSNENQMLNHFNASAFTRYVNKASHMSNSNPSSISRPKDKTGKLVDHSSDNALERSYSAKDSLLCNYS